MQLKIFKGVLEQEQFKKIKQFFFDINTSWFYQPKMITKSSNDDRGFFSHALFHDSRITSNAFELMSPLLDSINDESLTGIYYLNKCNGYTEFDNEEKTKVYSEPNKIVIFNCKLKHRMVSQTDENRRLLINLNYFPK
jgi:hypothetical protein